MTSESHAEMEAGRAFNHYSEVAKSTRVKDLAQVCKRLNDERARFKAEIAELKAKLAEAEKTIGKRELCDCGHLVGVRSPCIVCGAPQCCPICCHETTLKMKLAAAEKERDDALALRDEVLKSTNDAAYQAVGAAERLGLSYSSGGRDAVCALSKAVDDLKGKLVEAEKDCNLLQLEGAHDELRAEKAKAECAVLQSVIESAIARITAAEVFPPDAGHPMIQMLVEEFGQVLAANPAGAKALEVLKAAVAAWCNYYSSEKPTCPDCPYNEPNTPECQNLARAVEVYLGKEG